MKHTDFPTTPLCRFIYCCILADRYTLLVARLQIFPQDSSLVCGRFARLEACFLLVEACIFLFLLDQQTKAPSKTCESDNLARILEM